MYSADGKTNFLKERPGYKTYRKQCQYSAIMQGVKIMFIRNMANMKTFLYGVIRFNTFHTSVINVFLNMSVLGFIYISTTDICRGKLSETSENFMHT